MKNRSQKITELIGRLGRLTVADRLCVTDRRTYQLEAYNTEKGKDIPGPVGCLIDIIYSEEIGK